MKFACLLLVALLAGGCSKLQVNPLDSGEPLGFILSLVLLSSTDVVAVGGNCTVWSGPSTGPRETSVLPGCTGSALLNGVAYGSGRFVIVGETGPGTGCGIWTSANGRHWSQQACPITLPLGSVAFHSGTKTFAAGGYCVTPAGVSYEMLRSVDGGVSWAMTGTIAIGGPCVASDKIHSTAASFAGPSDFVALNTFAGNLGRSFDNGSTWGSAPFTPNVAIPTRVFAGHGGRVIASGSSGGNPATSSTNDNGTSAFTAAAVTGFSGTTGAVLAKGTGTTILAVGNNCGLAGSADNAATWTPVGAWSECTSEPVNWTVLGVTSNGRFVAGGNAVAGGTEVFGSSDGGAAGTWRITRLTSSNPIRAMVVAE